jgi:putative flavoprotein involved in K+ transport
MDRKTNADQFEVIVIGGGQAGLATGYYLAQAGVRFIILDAGERVGDVWRKRWDSLKLFTPAEYDNLPGMPCPVLAGYLPSKDELADYLEAYAEHFGLPVRLKTRVDSLTREDRSYLVTSGSQRFAAAHVVVATGALQSPKLPDFATKLNPSILQLHSSHYRSPDQLQSGDVLIVGVGQSGAEIGREVAATRQTWLSGQARVHLPRFVLGRHIFSWLWPILSRINRDNWLGRLLAARMGEGGDPVVGISLKDLARSGIKRVPRIVDVEEGKPMTADGQILDVANVIWATGFCSDYRWLSLPIFHYDGYPLHKRGVVEGEPGLYFVGLRFQYRPTSHLVGGVSTDARYIVRRIVQRINNPAYA